MDNTRSQTPASDADTLGKQQPQQKSKVGGYVKRHTKAVGAGGFSLAKSFKKFITRGNVIDLAVALVIGAAFTAIVTSFVNDLITPLIGLAMGGQNLQNLFIVLRSSPNGTTTFPTPEVAQKEGAVTWNYGNFMQVVINFFIIALCMFVIVFAVEKSRRKEVIIDTEMKCTFCKSPIDNSATRCKFCTSQVIPTRVEEAPPAVVDDEANMA